MIHILLHFVVPVGVALLFFRKEWEKPSLWMIATMIVDLDHLLADPIYDPNRCSIDFHPLHSYELITVCALMFIITGFVRYRQPIESDKSALQILFWISLGLLIHMALDWTDCW